ncbi:hypothetical protein D3C73_872330 [compost metagenome]
MAQIHQVPGGLGGADPVVGHHHVLGLVQGDRGDADIGGVQLAQQFDHRLVLGHRGRHDDAEQPLAFDEAANVLQQGGGGAAARMHHQFQARSLQGVQDALLHVDHIGGAGLVVDHPDQEGPAEGQAARLRIGHEAQFVDRLLNAGAGFLAHERRLVDDARHGLLGDLRHAGDVIDGGALAGFRRLRIPF